MKTRPVVLPALCVLAALGGSACSLVTVPVKVAGGIIETTVETTGQVIAAPFNAMGGGKKSDKEEKSTPETETPAPPNGNEEEKTDSAQSSPRTTNSQTKSLDSNLERFGAEFSWGGRRLWSTCRGPLPRPDSSCSKTPI